MVLHDYQAGSLSRHRASLKRKPGGGPFQSTVVRRQGGHFDVALVFGGCRENFSMIETFQG